MVEKGFISESMRYEYTKSNVTYYEFHVDDHETFQMACQHLEFGGYLSVWKPEDKNAIMMFGQDEAILRQNLFSLLAWTHPDGTKPLIPKDTGMGIMISAFTSRELGFGFPVSNDILAQVNLKRRGTKYSDEVAAQQIKGTPLKQELTSLPFIQELEHGKNSDGFWTYDHMVLQFEDCIDVLKHLYPQFDYVFFLTIAMVTTDSNLMG